jgi:glycosyl transferase family 2
VSSPLKKWHEQIQSNAASIAERRSDFKILLKTKNDRWLLKEWIEHHAPICGMDSLIIFDNDSSDEQVFEIYQSSHPDLLIYNFSGHHNNLHFVDKNPELYRALAESCRFFIFLDTDEFLHWIDGSGHHDTKIAARLSSQLGEAEGDFICGTWLPNVAWDATRYWIGEDNKILLDGVKWGKPLLKTSSLRNAFINHNIQARECGLLPVQCGSLVVQHRNRVHREQRLMSNINKLRQRRVIVELDESIEHIHDRISQAVDPNVVLYLREILELRNADGTTKSYVRGFVKFAPDGRLEFPGNSEKEMLFSFVNSPADIIELGLAQNSSS